MDFYLCISFNYFFPYTHTPTHKITIQKCCFMFSASASACRFRLLLPLLLTIAIVQNYNKNNERLTNNTERKKYVLHTYIVPRGIHLSVSLLLWMRAGKCTKYQCKMLKIFNKYFCFLLPLLFTAMLLGLWQAGWMVWGLHLVAHHVDAAAKNLWMKSFASSYLKKLAIKRDSATYSSSSGGSFCISKVSAMEKNAHSEVR